MLAGDAAVIEINVDHNPGLAARFAVRGVPVIHLLRGGKTVDQLAGAHPADSIVAWFRGRANR